MTTAVKNSVYRLEIVSDTDAASPRRNDNLGTMVCWHRRYNLGDEHNFHNADAFLFELLEKTVGDTEKAEQKYDEISGSIDRESYRTHGAYHKAIIDELLDFVKQKFIILPLYLYDHSGITMNTTGFSCPWDSGQVGWIYVAHDKLMQEFGIKEITPETIAKTETILRAEVEEYDHYIRGDCYGFRLYENGQEIDSCYGFIGDFEEVKDRIKEYLPENVRELADAAQYGEEIDEDELEL